MSTGGRLACRVRDGRTTTSLADAAQLVGFRRAGNAFTNVLLRNHGLHIDIAIDKSHPIGKQHPAGIKDVVLESALTTIMDCEDSVAAVDAADKTVVYRNWCGIMRGTLTASVAKGSRHDRAAPESPIASTRHRTALRSRCRGAACCSCATSARTC